MNGEVSKHRPPDWNEQEDTTLSEIVLTHLRTGSTQLKAFQEAAERITGRTAAACGFRWNSVVRKNIKDQIDAAREEKKAYVSALSEAGSTKSSSEIAQPHDSNVKKERNQKKVTDLNLLESLLAPERVQEHVDYIQGLCANLSLFQRMRESLERKDREINNLKERVNTLETRNKRLEYLEENWREFSTFAERVKLNG